MFFIKGSDSAVRVDQVTALAAADDGVVVILLSGEKVLVRKTLDEFMDLMAQAYATAPFQDGDE